MYSLLIFKDFKENVPYRHYWCFPHLSNHIYNQVKIYIHVEKDKIVLILLASHVKILKYEHLCPTKVTP